MNDQLFDIKNGRFTDAEINQAGNDSRNMLLSQDNQDSIIDRGA